MSILSSIAGWFGFDTATNIRFEDYVFNFNTISGYKARNQRYTQNWWTYYGADLEQMTNEDETPATKVNYIKRNIDKVVYFAFGRGFNPVHPRHTEDLKMAMSAWNNKLVERLTQIGQFGSVSGDAYIMVAPVKKGETSTQFNPETIDLEATADARVSIMVINSSYCLPEYDAFDRDKMVAMNIIIPQRTNNPSADAAESMRTALTETGTMSFTWMRITAEEVAVWSTDTGGQLQGQIDRRPNPLGEIYVRHIRNYPFGDSLFGMDDIQEVRRLSQEITDGITDIGSILKYHGHPITCLFGFKAGNLKKGANKIWSNLPKDGDVKNLELDSDMKASSEYVAGLKEDLHALMGVPEIAQGTKQAISNTSGIALQTMYLPLIERAQNKQSIYSPEFIEVLILVLKWKNKLKQLTYIDPDTGKEKKRDGRAAMDDVYYEDIRQFTVLQYPSPLPKEQQQEIQNQIALMGAHLQTREGALTVLGEQNPKKKLEAIKEDLKEIIELKKMEAEAMQFVKLMDERNKPDAPDDPSASKREGEDKPPPVDPDKGTTEKQQGRPKSTGAGARNNG